MFHTRLYQASDAKSVLSWATDSLSFYQWSAGLFGSYPIPVQKLENELENRSKTGNFYPYIITCDDQPVCFFVLRYPGAKRDTLRLAFLIMNPEYRGKGYAKKMVEQALKTAQSYEETRRITLVVFENNVPAYHCYLHYGFKETGHKEAYPIDDMTWNCIEMDYKL